MGMDVFGKAPTSPEGEYFRANVWTWRPIAQMLEDLFGRYIAPIEHLHTNDGDGLDAEGAEALGVAMLEGHGAIEKYVLEWEERREAIPKDRCTLCGGTGVRTDKVGVEHGFDKKVTRNALGVAKVGWCNGCDGTGESENTAAWYSMDLDHVMEFACFVRASGGFEIH